MVYLDYSATTPVLHDVLESYNKTTKSFIGNVNSIHSLGVKSKELMDNATKQIAELLNIDDNEIIYTSGATESNNMALIGSIKALKKTGEIIVSKLEHPSIYNICNYLEKLGNKIVYVNNDSEGLVDFEDLKNKVNENTLLVSICAVNSELGIRQPLKTLRQIIKKENKSTLFHSDITQAIGKVSVSMHDVDLATFSSHKIYGPKGIGALYKAKNVKLEPLFYGSDKYNLGRAGTPSLPLIVAFSKALRIALKELDQKEIYVGKLCERLVNYFSQIDRILINHSKYAIPHILNISLMSIKSETFVHALEEKEIFVSTTTACTKGNDSFSIMSLYNDKKRAGSSIRISISYMTTNEEIKKFITVFDELYNSLNYVREV